MVLWTLAEIPQVEIHLSSLAPFHCDSVWLRTDPEWIEPIAIVRIGAERTESLSHFVSPLTVPFDQRRRLVDHPGVSGQNQVGLHAGQQFCSVDVTFLQDATVASDDRLVPVLKRVAGIA